MIFVLHTVADVILSIKYYESKVLLTVGEGI